jgi:adenine-specific DNA-methyltransferase
MASQLPLFPLITARFPSTRYQGSKAKLTDWIWDNLKSLPFTTCLDAFGGTGAVAYRLKQEGKQVTYNDLLCFNALIGQALIENNSTRLGDSEINALLQKQANLSYPTFVHDHFADIYFTDAENTWIDQTITHLFALSDPYKYALAFFALCQACIIKRPYNLFHRKNLYIRFANVQRSFGNKTTWDKPFEEWFRFFAAEANQAVFNNGQTHTALNLDAAAVPGNYDLVYLDPPYISRRGVSVDYYSFYHFLEGLSQYQDWEARIDYHSKHHRLKPQPSEWTDKTRITEAFEKLFRRFQNSMIVVSYRSDGIPSESVLTDLLRQYKSQVRVERSGQYQYVLSKNSRTEELLLIGT